MFSFSITSSLRLLGEEISMCRVLEIRVPGGDQLGVYPPSRPSSLVDRDEYPLPSSSVLAASVALVWMTDSLSDRRMGVDAALDIPCSPRRTILGGESWPAIHDWAVRAGSLLGVGG